MTRAVRYQVLLALLACSSGHMPGQTGGMPKEFDRAPAFSITTDQGMRISPRGHDGSLLVVNFWETACAPCVAELPSLSAFARKFRSKQVVVVAISGDEDRQEYSRFLRDHRIDLETYRDPTRRIGKSFGTVMYPESYIIRDGRIIRKIVGSIDWTNEEISSYITKRLAR